MKKIPYIFIILLLAAFVGCDRIEGPYTEIVDQEIVTVDFPDLDVNSVYRKVLIEEYTGHRCPNCPMGHQKLEELAERFGDTLVAVGIHAGALAAPTTDLPYDFRTSVGNELAQEYSIDGIPAAIINRLPEAGGWSPARWESKVTAAIRDNETLAAVQLINEYNPILNTIKANAKVTLLDDYPNALRLAFFIVEDNIVKPQINGTDTILDYVHNHVLRASMNGTYGEFLNQSGYLEENVGYTYAKTMKLDGTGWNPNNCRVMAILYDKTNSLVLQVEEAPFIKVD